MKEREEILFLVNKYVKSKLEYMTVSDLKREMRSHIVDNYDNYPLDDFIMICKIDELVGRKLISSTIADGLRQLLNKKIQLNEMIRKVGLLSIRGLDIASNTQRLNELLELNKQVINVLKSYHLVLEDIDYLNYQIDTLTANDQCRCVEEDSELDEVVNILNKKIPDEKKSL